MNWKEIESNYPKLYNLFGSYMHDNADPFYDDYGERIRFHKDDFDFEYTIGWLFRFLHTHKIYLNIFPCFSGKLTTRLAELSGYDFEIRFHNNTEWEVYAPDDKYNEDGQRISDFESVYSEAIAKSFELLDQKLNNE